MSKSWVARQLSFLFGQADTSHWAAVALLMEQSFGKIIIDVPVEGGNVRAFFKKQVLVGDTSLSSARRSQDGSLTVDMDEPIGFGKNRDAAVIDLWEKLTSLRIDEGILQYEQMIGNGEPHAEYTSFRFRNGKFGGVTTYNECPPDRHPIIQKYFSDHRFDTLIAKAEDEVFGVRKPA